jgi:hypothetical protein
MRNSTYVLPHQDHTAAQDLTLFCRISLVYNRRSASSSQRPHPAVEEGAGAVHIRHIHRVVFLAAVLAVVSFAAASAGAGIRDGRSPDTKDAAYLAHLDGRSPDTIDAAAAAHATANQPAIDRRSPDTRDAAAAAHARQAPPIVIVGNSGFDWTDAGIGAAGGFALALLLGAAFLLTHRGSRQKLVL